MTGPPDPGQSGSPTGQPSAGSPTGQPSAGSPTGQPSAGSPTGRPIAEAPTGPVRPRRLTTRLRAALADTRPLRTPAYRRLWAAGVVTVIGAQLSVVAVPTQVYAMTGSSAYVGLTGLFGLVPLVVFGLWGGAIADAMDRRTLLLVTGSGIAASSLGFWVVAAAGIGNVWVVLSLFAVQSALLAVNQPTRSAVIPRLLPMDQIAAAVALGTTVFMLGAVIGPLLAGVLIPVVGLPTLYLLDAVALLATLWATWRLPPVPPPPSEGARRRAGMREVLAGFRYVALHRILLVSFLVDIVAMVFGMPRVLFPQLAEQTFGDPPGGGVALGLLFAAIPLGAVLGGLFSGYLHRVRRQGVAVTVAICVWGAAVALFGLAEALWLAVLLLAVGGAADMVSAVYRTTMLQVVATDEMRGRIQGVFLVVVAGGPRLADIWHGSAAEVAGPGAVVTVGGVAVLVGVVIVVALLPQFWRYRAPV